MTASPNPDPREARFTALVAAVYEPLQRYAARRVDHAEVPDVVSETLLVLWRRLDEVPAGAELPWAYGVARHCVANQQRSAVRRHRLWQRAASDAAAGALVDPGRAPSDDDLDADVAAALDELGDRDRELVLLWAWEGLQPREIAVVLGTSANAVSLRLSRARRRLRTRLRGRQRQAYLRPVSEPVSDTVSEDETR